MKHVRELEPGDKIRVDGFWYRVMTDPEPTGRTVWVYGERRNSAVTPLAFSNDAASSAVSRTHDSERTGGCSRFGSAAAPRLGG
jgi:hypothetical protein